MGLLHPARVLRTCLVQRSLRVGSRGDMNRLTFRLHVLEHPAAIQRFTILLKNVQSCEQNAKEDLIDGSPCDVTSQ